MLINETIMNTQLKIERFMDILMAPQLALIASGQVGFVGYLYHPLSGTHNLNDPVGIQSLFLP